MPHEKRPLLFFLVAALAISTIFGIVKISFESPKMVKEGRIEDIEYYRWDYASAVDWEEEQRAYSTGQPTTLQWSKPPNTVLQFEDGERILFADIIPDIEIGRIYRIVYHKQHVYARGNHYWSGKYYILDNMEEI